MGEQVKTNAEAMRQVVVIVCVCVCVCAAEAAGVSASQRLETGTRHAEP